MEPYAIALITVGSIVTAYAMVSAVLLRAPPLPWTIRKGPTLQPIPKKIAHRGGSLLGPENTMLAFRRAVEHEHVDMLELDLCMTADSVVVVSHDDHLNRLCQRDAYIHELHYSDLPRLHQRIPLHFPAPSQREYSMSDEELSVVGLQPFCRFEDLLEAFPNVPLHVDCKYSSVALVHEAVRLVREHKRESTVVIGAALNPNAALIKKLALAAPPSMSEAANGSTKPLHPSGPLITFASALDVVAVYAMYYLGILPLIPLSFAVFDIPLPTAFLRKRFNHPVLSWLLNTPKLWAHLRRRGIIVYGFVLNSKYDVREAREWPIDGIMTDDPSVFAE